MRQMSPLLRAAQLNLIVPAKERRLRERAEREHALALRADAEKYRRDERQRKRDRIKFLRAELQGFEHAETDIRADSFYSRDPAMLQGALEEIDSQREKVQQEIWELEYA